MKREPKTEVIFVKADKSLAKRLQKAALLTDTTMSALTREAVREKLDQLAEKYPQLAAA
jgi:predicted transcriptional regulator